MGCGASADGGGNPEEDDGEDPKLAAYLKMRGFSGQVEEVKAVGLSPAEARRRGLMAGQTPGARGDINDGFTKAAVEESSEEEESEEEESEEEKAASDRRNNGTSGPLG